MREARSNMLIGVGFAMFIILTMAQELNVQSALSFRDAVFMSLGMIIAGGVIK